MSAAFYTLGATPANKWSAKDEAALRKHYATMPWPQLMDLLGKTRRAIYAKAYNLNLTRTEQHTRHEHQNFTIGATRVIKNKPVAKPVADVPVLNSTSRGTYNGAELRFHAARPGALDAYLLPSRAGDRRTYRVEAVCTRGE